MADAILVAVTVAFIVICVGYVQWCDRIIGKDDFGPEPLVDTVGSDSAAEPEAVVPA